MVIPFISESHPAIGMKCVRCSSMESRAYGLCSLALQVQSAKLAVECCGLQGKCIACCNASTQSQGSAIGTGGRSATEQSGKSRTSRSTRALGESSWSVSFGCARVCPDRSRSLIAQPCDLWILSYTPARSRDWSQGWTGLVVDVKIERGRWRNESEQCEGKSVSEDDRSPLPPLRPRTIAKAIS